MNGSLLSPFSTGHPTAIQTSLLDRASFAKFDPSGRYLAAGKLDGTASIWDLETRSTVRMLDGHVKAVTNVDWSRYSRYLLTSSKDWNVIIWDLESPFDPPQRHNTIRFDAPVLSASFHPRNSNIILALLSTGEAYIADLRREHRSRIELCETVDESNEDAQSGRSHSAMTVARFDPTGKHIFIGTAAGCVLVFNSRTKSMIARHKIAGAGTMKSFDFPRTGRRLVTNSSDRILRHFNLPSYPATLAAEDDIDQELKTVYQFSDPIGKTAWHGMSYSPDGQWLAGGAADPATHKIYIWDISNDGRFVCTLDGGREPLIHLHWHPLKAVIASTTNHGNILIWHCPVPERWGAFAGGFEEVDENVEYHEREDEFDIEDEAETALRKMKQEEQEVDINGVDNEVPKPEPLSLPKDDEDAAWADEEPDEDVPGWKIKIVMVDEMDYM